VLPPFSLPFQNEKEESCFAGEKKIIYKFVKSFYFFTKVEVVLVKTKKSFLD